MAIHLLSFLQSLKRRVLLWQQVFRKITRAMLIGTRNRLAYMCGHDNPWASPIADGTLISDEDLNAFKRYDGLRQRWVVLRESRLDKLIAIIMSNR